eukprot:TRINITY_DN33072_c0_g1_i1.p1 TRINITY_DN33072_c0_g1~~TRINITY_DN33072_c0_g1_i1.p1  ORF type:complete len:363 (+),score=147.04 TRINITY_DN33072_c0_g1_i1:64-1152(+)
MRAAAMQGRVVPCRRVQRRKFSASAPRFGRESWGHFMQQPRARPAEYQKGSPRSIADMHHGWNFPYDKFAWQQPMQMTRGSPSVLAWYSAKGMRRASVTKPLYWNWYQNALGGVEYMDGYGLPEIQDPKDLLPEEGADEPVDGRVPIIATGRAREYAKQLEKLRANPDRTVDEVSEFLDQLDREDPDSADFSLVGQPRAVFEVTLLLAVESDSWLAVDKVLSWMGDPARAVPVRGVMAGVLFSRVHDANKAVRLFELMKKSGVPLHINAYYSVSAALQRIEEADMAAGLKERWLQRGSAADTVDGDMVDFIVGGCEDQLFPETNPLTRMIAGQDAEQATTRAVQQLLDSERQLIRTDAAPRR